MAVRIEEQLGREALAATVETGPIAFIQTYNSIAEKGMEIHFFEPAGTSGPDYRELRTAALEGDLTRVRDILQDIQSGQIPLLNLEVEGHLMYTTGYILLRNGDLDLAEDVFQTLNTLHPEIASVYVGLGDVYVGIGKTAATIAAYERAVELGSNDFWMKMRLAELKSVQNAQ